MECSFCGKVIPPGKGLTYVKVDNTVLNFCSRKCMSYYLMKRNPAKLKWARKREV